MDICRVMGCFWMSRRDARRGRGQLLIDKAVFREARVKKGVCRWGI